MSRAVWIPIICCLGMFVSAAVPANGAEDRDSVLVRIDPERIIIPAFYNGAVIQVSGDVPRCDQVLLKLEGGEAEMELNRKGKVFAFWMNVAQIKVKDAPESYIIQASEEISKICSEKMLDSLEIGYPYLRERIRFSSDKPLTGEEFADFIALQEHRGVYQTLIGGIELQDSSPGRKVLSSGFPLPANVPPGVYEITLYCFQGGQIVGIGSADLTIEMKGMPLYMSVIAFQHPAVYGVVAIIVAMAAGLLIGVIFTKSAPH